MDVQLLIVPYDTARPGWRMGAGPEHLLDGGLAARLVSAGHKVHVSAVAPQDAGATAEIGTAFELMRLLAWRVRDAVEAGRFPLVLSGNCNSATGTLSGLTPRKRAVFWFDAHGDVNTPETTASGFLDGMALATALGWCWRRLAAAVEGFEPVDPETVCLIGARDLDPPERDRLHRARIATVAPADGAESELAAFLEAAPDDHEAYIHCDLDVLDPGVGRANPFQVGGGLGVDAVESAIRAIAAAMPLAAAAITAYAPELDVDGRMRDAAFRIIDALIESAAKARFEML